MVFVTYVSTEHLLDVKLQCYELFLSWPLALIGSTVAGLVCSKYIYLNNKFY